MTGWNFNSAHAVAGGKANGRLVPAAAETTHLEIMAHAVRRLPGRLFTARASDKTEPSKRAWGWSVMFVICGFRPELSRFGPALQLVLQQNPWMNRDSAPDPGIC
ncbi:MAG: hypothetical protein HRF43_17555 [Phycisphaerae bacterium]|jgi:hypothetical protein